jgi:hypothetical protein
MRQGWQLIFRWERSALGDEPKRRIRWAPIIVTLALIAAGLSILSTVWTPAPTPAAPVAHYRPAVTLSPSPSPAGPEQVTNVQLPQRVSALCIVPTGKPGKRAVVVRVP